MAKVVEHTRKYHLDDRKLRRAVRTELPSSGLPNLADVFSGFLSHITSFAEAAGQREAARKRIKEIQKEFPLARDDFKRLHALRLEEKEVLAHLQQAKVWISTWEHVADMSRLQIIVKDPRDKLAPKARQLLEMKTRATQSRQYALDHDKEITKLNDELKDLLMRRRPPDEFRR